MKKVVSKKGVAFVLGSFLFAISSHAGFIEGTVIPGTDLACQVKNTTKVPQHVYQIDYEFVCNFGASNPFDSQVASTDCLAHCDLVPGAERVYTNGPYTRECRLMSAECRVQVSEN